MKKHITLSLLFILSSTSLFAQTPAPVQTTTNTVTTTTVVTPAPVAQAPVSFAPIEKGFTTSQVIQARGEPFYKSSHGTKDGTTVWLYTRPDVSQQVNEIQTTDPVRQVPATLRTITSHSCVVADLYVTVRAGRVVSTQTASAGQVMGRCETTTREEYVPLPVPTKKKKR